MWSRLLPYYQWFDTLYFPQEDFMIGSDETRWSVQLITDHCPSINRRHSHSLSSPFHNHNVSATVYEGVEAEE